MHVTAAGRWRLREDNLRRMKECFLSAGEKGALLCTIHGKGKDDEAQATDSFLISYAIAA